VFPRLKTECKGKEGEVTQLTLMQGESRDDRVGFLGGQNMWGIGGPRRSLYSSFKGQKTKKEFGA